MNVAQARHPTAYHMLTRANRVFRFATTTLLSLAVWAFVLMFPAALLLALELWRVAALLGMLYGLAVGVSLLLSASAAVVTFVLTFAFFFRYTLLQLVGAILTVGFGVVLLIKVDGAVLYLVPASIIGFVILYAHVRDHDPTETRWP